MARRETGIGDRKLQKMSKSPERDHRGKVNSPALQSLLIPENVPSIPRRSVKSWLWENSIDSRWTCSLKGVCPRFRPSYNQHCSAPFPSLGRLNATKFTRSKEPTPSSNQPFLSALHGGSGSFVSSGGEFHTKTMGLPSSFAARISSSKELTKRRNSGDW